MYLIKLYKELRIWLRVRKILKQNLSLLDEKGFRVDWVGRAYTVINIPDEVLTSSMPNESYVYMKLQEYSPVFLEVGIADYVSPEIMEIPESGAYLLIISPDRNYLKFFELLKFTFKIGAILILLRILYLIFTLSPVVNFFSNLFNIFVNGN